MSSWVLQLALLAACLRFGCAEGDPLPPALVELVRSSPISSIQDLQLLLLTDSVEEGPDSQLSRGLHSNYTFSRLPRSLDAQPAQQAQCKVRTEVLEVTRAMLDRRNANFMLWPPCVEVQRCSGCCNARTMQCVPIITHTRYLQVMKIQYVHMRPHYDKAIISVQDHVECRCQSAPPPKTPRTNPKKHQPRRQSPKAPHVKVRPKEELHRLDELKQNQKFQLGDREIPVHHWQRPDALTTQTEPEVRERNSLLDHGRSHNHNHNHTRQREMEEPGRPHRPKLQSDYQDVVASGLPRDRINSTEQWLLDDQRPQQGNLTEYITEYDPVHRNVTEQVTSGETRLSNHSFAMEDWDLEAQANKTQAESPPLHQRELSQLTELEHPHNHNHTAETERGQYNQTQHKDNEPPGIEERRLRLLEQEQRNLEEEKRELLLLHQKLDEEKQRLKQQQQQQQQHHHHHDHQHHHLNHQMHTHTTTQRAETVLPTTTKPPAPPTFRAPNRHAPPRRRMRKNRNRISKAAMRAMLM